MAVARGRASEGSPLLATRARSFDDARAEVRSFEAARRSLELFRAAQPRRSDRDFARELVASIVARS